MAGFQLDVSENLDSKITENNKQVKLIQKYPR